jgi:hypothetical protein
MSRGARDRRRSRSRSRGTPRVRLPARWPRGSTRDHYASSRSSSAWRAVRRASASGSRRACRSGFAAFFRARKGRCSPRAGRVESSGRADWRAGRAPRCTCALRPTRRTTLSAKPNGIRSPARTRSRTKSMPTRCPPATAAIRWRSSSRCRHAHPALRAPTSSSGSPRWAAGWIASRGSEARPRSPFARRPAGPGSSTSASRLRAIPASVGCGMRSACRPRSAEARARRSRSARSMSSPAPISIWPPHPAFAPPPCARPPCRPARPPRLSPAWRETSHSEAGSELLPSSPGRRAMRGSPRRVHGRSRGAITAPRSRDRAAARSKKGKPGSRLRAGGSSQAGCAPSTGAISRVAFRMAWRGEPGIGSPSPGRATHARSAFARQSPSARAESGERKRGSAATPNRAA